MPLPIAIAYEHRLYLASLSIIAPAVCWPVLRVKKLATAVVWILAVALFFSAFTFERNRVWENYESLWSDTAMKSPTLLWSWHYYCLALGETGKCGRTILACSLAEAVAEDNYKVHNNLGICYFKTGRSALAEKELLKAFEYSPKNVDSAALNLGIFYRETQDLEKASQYFGLALERNPQNDKTRQTLVRTYAEAGRCREALDLVRSAPGAFPDLSEIARLCPNPLQ
jgi:tetratricopeptide (TPR) repeat protein